MRDNLGRFVPGSSGNPKGRQSKDRETKYLSVAQRVCGFREWREIVLVAVDQAKEGDAQARRWLSEYLIGKPVPIKDTVGDEDVRIHVTYDKQDPPLNIEWIDAESELQGRENQSGGLVIDVNDVID